MNASMLTLILISTLTGPTDTTVPAAAVSRVAPRSAVQSAVRSAVQASAPIQYLVMPIEDVQVPAREAGPLQSISISEGDWVEAGQALAQIEDRPSTLDKSAAEKKRDAARTRAEDDIEVRFAVASFEVAEAELTQSLEINRRSPGSVTEADIRRLRLTRRRAELQIDKSRLERKVAQMTAAVEDIVVRSAEESIARRKIVSPINGVIISLLKGRGEWVNVGEPVARIVRMDRLRVDGFLLATIHDPTKMHGRRIIATVEMTGGRRESFSGKIVFVSPLNQVGNRYRIRAEVQNRMVEHNWVLRPGMQAVLTLADQ